MKNNSLSIKLFTALTLSLVITVVIFNIISNYAVMNSFEYEISKNSIGKLKVAENMIVQLKDTINKDTIRLTVNSAVNALADIQENKANLFNTDNLFKLSKVIDIISEIVKTNNSYHSIYLYLEDLGYVFTSSQGFVSENSLSDTGWMKYYKDFKKNGTALSWIETRLPDDGNNDIGVGTSEHVITYIYPLTPYTTNLRGALVVNIREQVLNKRINSNNFNSEGYIIIINSKGNVISHVNDKLLCENISDKKYIDRIITSQSAEGYLVTNIDGSKSLVSYYKSYNNDWIYIGIFSLDNLISKVKLIRTYTIYISSLIVAIGVIIAYLISRRLYNPVKKLIQDIQATKGIDFKDNEDEMEILCKAFDTLKKRDECLFDILERNRRNINESYLNNLLRGNCSCVADKNILEVDFQYPYYTCAIISIDKYSEFSKSYKGKQQYYVKMMILKVAEEVLNPSFICAGINIDKGDIALIINTSYSNNNELHERLKAYFLKIQKEITKIFDYTISVGIGLCHPGEHEINASYMEAHEALKFKLKYGYESIIAWQKELTEHKYYYPFTTEKHILNYLDLKDKNGITNAVNGLMDEIRNKKGLSCDNVMQIFNQLVGNTIIKYLVDSYVDMSHVFGSGFNIYRELSTKETLDDIICWLIDVYNTVINYCSKLENNEKDKFKVIIEFIHKNYKNDIGIRDIADHVKISYSHIRKIFKDETGENIVDYINVMRVNEAKKLLVSTDMNIKDIALGLGYNNDQSFTRAFKKFEGITPGEYRNKIK